MALHHRPEVDNMRFAYCHSTKSQQSNSSASDSSSRSSNARSYQTLPTECSVSPQKISGSPPQIHDSHNAGDARSPEAGQPWIEGQGVQESPRASIESCPSTVDSDEEEVQEEDELPEYDVPPYIPQPYEPRVMPSTPPDFSQLFPSSRRLEVRHDDSTLDGNMNLRVDTKVFIHGRKCNMTLFHLRMHDLKRRAFSFRRYCRDSGREVCHSELKHSRTKTETRPGFQRSLSSAFSSMRPRSESRATPPPFSHLKRHDSGHGSVHSAEERHPGTSEPDTHVHHDTMKLEFSNYAQVDVKRTGVKHHKRYEFEYWGTHYAWRRTVYKEGSHKAISYHLTKGGNETALAHIVPTALPPSQFREEQSKGGWIPPSSMWLADHNLIHGLKDVVDVVVAAGLVAFVDDAIRQHFNSKNSKHLLIPIPTTQMGMEYVGPKRLINEMFRRDSDPSKHSSPSASHGHVPTHGHGATHVQRSASAPRRSSCDR